MLVSVCDVNVATNALNLEFVEDEERSYNPWGKLINASVEGGLTIALERSEG
ncbi:MAG: hypothetical protein ACTS6P_00895 [Candidatus Hodgkinia cicadicola]